MSAKQDRQGARTARDLEYRYNFGKSFAEAVGIATDAQRSAEQAQKDAEAAKSTADSTAEKLTHEEIFNLLTKDGTLQGLYRGDDGDLYFNAEFIKSGIIDAAVVQVVNLIAEKLKSVNADSCLEIDGANLKYFFQGNETVNVKNESIKTLTGAEGSPIMYMTDRSEDGEAVNFGEYSAHHIRIGGADVGSEGIILDGSDGNPTMALSGGSPIPLHWQGIGNGAYFLVGGTANIPDFIVEQGTSGIWTYRKWNSGIAECWGTQSIDTKMNTAWGTMYTGTVTPLINYPFTFTSVPVEQVTVHTGRYACWLFGEASDVGGRNTTTRTGAYNVARPTTSVEVKTLYFDYYVIGRWK